MEVDPQRAPLITEAFCLYATGEYTIEALAELMHSCGLMNRSRSDYDSMPVTINGMT